MNYTSLRIWTVRKPLYITVTALHDSKNSPNTNASYDLHPITNHQRSLIPAHVLCVEHTNTNTWGLLDVGMTTHTNWIYRHTRRLSWQGCLHSSYVRRTASCVSSTKRTCDGETEYETSTNIFIIVVCRMPQPCRIFSPCCDHLGPQHAWLWYCDSQYFRWFHNGCCYSPIPKQSWFIHRDTALVARESAKTRAREEPCCVAQAMALICNGRSNMY